MSDVTTLHVPGDGRWYQRETIVRIARTPRTDIVPDPTGDYEISHCDHASGLNGPPLLRVELQRLRQQA